MRATLVALALLAGCRCKQSGKVSNEPPPERPPDVLCEAVVRDPSATWERVRDVLGLAAVALPRTAFGALGDALHLPRDLEKQVEPNGPLAVVVLEREGALAWKLGDPGRAKPFLDSDAGRTFALNESFLVAASAPPLLTSHGPYLVRGLARTSNDVDARIDITDKGMRSETIANAHKRLSALLATLEADASDAPSDRARVVRELRELDRKWATWTAPVRFDLTLANDAVTVVSGPAGDTVRASISGEVIRFWVRSRAHL